jgi:hypothetical protein
MVWTFNPLTGRRIKINGPTHKKLLKQGFSNSVFGLDEKDIELSEEEDSTDINTSREEYSTDIDRHEDLCDRYREEHLSEYFRGLNLSSKLNSFETDIIFEILSYKNNKHGHILTCRELLNDRKDHRIYSNTAISKYLQENENHERYYFCVGKKYEYKGNIVCKLAFILHRDNIPEADSEMRGLSYGVRKLTDEVHRLSDVFSFMVSNDIPQKYIESIGDRIGIVKKELADEEKRDAEYKKRQEEEERLEQELATTYKYFDNVTEFAYVKDKDSYECLKCNTIMQKYASWYECGLCRNWNGCGGGNCGYFVTYYCSNCKLKKR